MRGTLCGNGLYVLESCRLQSDLLPRFAASDNNVRVFAGNSLCTTRCLRSELRKGVAVGACFLHDMFQPLFLKGAQSSHDVAFPAPISGQSTGLYSL
jgi:hypothetical protein